MHIDRVVQLYILYEISEKRKKKDKKTNYKCFKCISYINKTGSGMGVLEEELSKITLKCSYWI